MPKHPNKRKCEIAGCNAWAMRGSNLCAPHSETARVKRRRGTRTGSSTGLYSHSNTDDELALLLSPPDDLSDEIALCRVLAGRLMGVLKAPDLDSDGLVRLAGMAPRSANGTATLLRVKQVITCEAQDDLAGTIGNVLDQVNVLGEHRG